MQPTPKAFSYSRRSFLKTSALAASGVLVYGCVAQKNDSLIEILHLPKQFSRRADKLSANISGRYAENLRQLRYQINGSDWIGFARRGPRVPSPLFTIELTADELKAGANELKLEATPKRGEPEIVTVSFNYEPAVPTLPVTVDWANIDSSELDVQDGYWETFDSGDGWRVRPTPGFEDYDRVLNVTGAFPGGRRVETDLIVHSHSEDRFYGFGLLSLWGGHPDEPTARPRRGWSFGVTWYYSFYKGFGAELSYKEGEGEPQWVSAYRNYDFEFGKKYRLITECFPEVDTEGKHLRYRARIKWFADGEAEPESWVEVTDPDGKLVPEGEYSVAVLVHRSQADFGPVTVSSVEAVQVQDDSVQTEQEQSI